jgi:hypothetical protein
MFCRTEGSPIVFEVFAMKRREEKILSRAKIAKDAKIGFDKKAGRGRGLCELRVLGAISFLGVVWCEISGVKI